ncbi:hypothetical protein CVT25_010549 [Psilocybe cyanescens]|uniref:Uncharacterized protein n=1 Tax=Psilocybe cyanescens TaxID=93625 RepID=A0A409WJF4_PSICY|nr:hypothetical protein CVT25_010549 [Psilocybe cyanescens]
MDFDLHDLSGLLDPYTLDSTAKSGSSAQLSAPHHLPNREPNSLKESKYGVWHEYSWFPEASVILLL